MAEFHFPNNPQKWNNRAGGGADPLALEFSPKESLEWGACWLEAPESVVALCSTMSSRRIFYVFKVDRKESKIRSKSPKSMGSGLQLVIYETMKCCNQRWRPSGLESTKI